MEMNNDEILFLIKSRSILSDKYNYVVSDFMKDNNIKNKIDAIDLLDKKIEKIINKYFINSTWEEFIIFLNKVKELYLKKINDDKNQYMIFITDLYFWWLDNSIDSNYNKKFYNNKKLYNYIDSELNEIIKSCKSNNSKNDAISSKSYLKILYKLKKFKNLL